MKLKVITKNRETQVEESFEKDFHKEDIASLYYDRNGVYIVTRSGQMFKVESTLEILESILE